MNTRFAIKKRHQTKALAIMLKIGASTKMDDIRNVAAGLELCFCDSVRPYGRHAEVAEIVDIVFSLYEMADSIYMEGWLIRSRERGMHFPPFKSKWVRRYFVLRVCDKRLGTYALDEFRKEDKRRLRKSLDLVRCVQIDSHLQLADSSCATTSRFGGFQWIFSLYFTKGTSSQKKTPLYFVSESEEKMKDWVYNLCRACRLEKETDDDSSSFMQQHPSHVEAPSHRSTLPSSIGGLSIYSDRSSESMLDTPRSEVSREFEKSKRTHLHSRNFRNHSGQRHVPSTAVVRKTSNQRRHRRTDSLEGPRASSSASACSSVTSGHPSDEGDDDSTSCISQLSNLSCGPPVPPRTRLRPQYSSASSSTGVPVKRLAVDHMSHMGSPPTRSLIDEVMENDSSGETIKMHGIVPYENPESGFRGGPGFLPPAVDRSNKPAKLRLYDYDEEKVPEEMTIHGYNKSGNNFIRTSRTPRARASSKPRDMRDPPKSAGPLGRSRELDYFNPVPLDRTHSMRSPAPSDIEYIKIDAEKTQAVKQSIAQRATVD
nr:Pleckstrin homology domain containing protein [Haemonchus contortus]